MTRFLRIAIMAFLGFGVANAEQNGWFLGPDIGYGTISVPFDYSAKANGGNVVEALAGNYSGGGAAFGFMGGYKQFFNPYFGLRYYANINVIMAKMNSKISNQVNGLTLDYGDNRSAMLINYGANVDMLVNFIAREKNKVADFGAFLGVSLGGNSWSGQAINDIDGYIAKREAELRQQYQVDGLGWKTTRNFFDFSLNVGLRTNILVNHGVELSFRVPIVTNTFLNKQKTTNIANASFKVYTKNLSHITLRYTYSFGKPKKVVRKVLKKRKRAPIEQRAKQSQTKQRKTQQNDIDALIRDIENEL